MVCNCLNYLRLERVMNSPGRIICGVLQAGARKLKIYEFAVSGARPDSRLTADGVPLQAATAASLSEAQVREIRSWILMPCSHNCRLAQKINEPKTKTIAPACDPDL